MKHASGDWEGSLQALFEDYVSSHVAVCPDPGPCRDKELLGRAHEVLRASEPGGNCRRFPLYHGVLEQAVLTDLKHLSALVRATELLETLCLNLYLQPWRREIRSIKTFTGVFVYCLLPALSSRTLQSVLATIGYLPCEDSPSPSEYRLCEEVSPDRALKVGFEMLLARALCLYLLQLLQQDQLQVQEWVETLWGKVTSECNENPCTKPKEEEKEAAEEGSQSEEEQSAPSAEKECEEPRPQAQRLNSEDQSIVQMQMTYPDLVFRGRPLRQDRGRSGTSSAQDKPPQLPHRRAAQRGRTSLTDHGSMNKDNGQDEGQSGPPGLSLLITLRPYSSKTQASRHSTEHQAGADVCVNHKENNELGVSCEANEEPEKPEQLHVPHTFDIENKQIISVEEAEEQDSVEPTCPAGCQHCSQDHVPAQTRDEEDPESL